MQSNFMVAAVIVESCDVVQSGVSVEDSFDDWIDRDVFRVRSWRIQLKFTTKKLLANARNPRDDFRQP